ncbi:hypothetical protein Cdeb_02767 [Caldibacillus debilis GB1]|uniref:Uncharacterized protein n=1 Tax=Caldibacillus debilis GB1 TaxID=1339248 RepID=A0A420VIR2_9BACI|nr:hypothetical protein Cdeb_02767 [Caldibacillus debilis GB1]
MGLSDIFNDLFIIRKLLSNMEKNLSNMNEKMSIIREKIKKCPSSFPVSNIRRRLSDINAFTISEKMIRRAVGKRGLNRKTFAAVQ